MKSWAQCVAHLKWRPASGLVDQEEKVWGYSYSWLSSGCSLLRPLGDSCCVARSAANPPGTCLVSEGFLSTDCLMIIQHHVRHQRGAAGLKIALAYKEGLPGTDPQLPPCFWGKVTGEGEAGTDRCTEGGAGVPLSLRGKVFVVNFNIFLRGSKY